MQKQVNSYRANVTVGGYNSTRVDGMKKMILAIKMKAGTV